MGRSGCWHERHRGEEDVLLRFLLYVSMAFGLYHLVLC